MKSSPAHRRVLSTPSQPRPTSRQSQPPCGPQPFDPAGPEEYTWPRGWFNFANVVLGLSLLVVLTIAVLAWNAR